MPYKEDQSKIIDLSELINKDQLYTNQWKLNNKEKRDLKNRNNKCFEKPFRCQKYKLSKNNQFKSSSQKLSIKRGIINSKKEIGYRKKGNRDKRNSNKWKEKNKKNKGS